MSSTSSNLVVVGRHFLSNSDLTHYLEAIKPEDVGPKGFGAKAALDNEGVRILLLWSIRDGGPVARGAFAFDWSEGWKLGADVSLFKF